MIEDRVYNKGREKKIPNFSKSKLFYLLLPFIFFLGTSENPESSKIEKIIFRDDLSAISVKQPQYSELIYDYRNAITDPRYPSVHIDTINETFVDYKLRFFKDARGIERPYDRIFPATPENLKEYEEKVN